MFSLVLTFLLAALLVACSVRFQRPPVDHRLTAVLLVSYFVRLAIAPLTHDLNIFTNAATDSTGYEAVGAVFARTWQYTGVHYIGGDEVPGVENTSLPYNLFAAVAYLNGEPTHLGCMAIVAAAACFVCLDLYLLAILIGAPPNVALWTAAVVSALPNFLFYTCNTYKDGLVALFVIGILGCAIRLSRRFSIPQLLLAGVCLGGLWLTRYYLVYIVPAPLLIGFFGFRSRSILRVLLAGLAVAASTTAVYAYSSAPAAVVSHARGTFEGATSKSAVDANAESGGSGVKFEETSPATSFVGKLAYTLFSPFPWQSGSLGLQLGKLEVLLWYYFVYRAVLAAKILWRDRRSDLLLFSSFVVPLTIAYAFTFANIGLIARQRIDILIAVILMASVSWSTATESSAEPVAAEPVGPARRTALAGGPLPRRRAHDVGWTSSPRVERPVGRS